MVGNRSAVGEQYVELQPQTDTAPYLADGSEIAQDDTPTPIATEKLLTDISDTVERRQGRPAARPSTSSAPRSTAPATDLQTIIDTSNSFITTADANFDVTTALIRDSNTVLQTARSTRRARSGRSRGTSRCSSTTLAGSDKDLRR